MKIDEMRDHQSSTVRRSVKREELARDINVARTHIHTLDVLSDALPNRDRAASAIKALYTFVGQLTTLASSSDIEIV